jgi:DNA-binding LacI/PurR family transcriptional regulator
VEHLAERGHRRVAYLDGGGVHRVRSTSDVAERREAALRELDRRGILASDGWISGGSGGEISGNLALAAEQWRAADPETRPTAFLAYDEWLALDLIKALDAQVVRVPEAVSVCAVAAAGGPAYHGQPLSCCCFDFLGMGIEAVRLPQFRENGDGLTGGKPAE